MLTSKTRLTATALAVAVAVLSGCGSDEQDNRPAADIGPSTVPSADADLDSIVIGWGQQLAPDQITHPSAADLDVTCTDRDDNLKVKIVTPQGWKILLSHGSQTMRVENAEKNLEADLDTSKIPTPTPQIDWTQPNEVDLAAHAIVPDDWRSPYGPGQQFYLLAHIDCR